MVNLPEEQLLSDIESLSQSLGDKFEEIRLIHDLTAQLQLEDDPRDTCRELLKQLDVCVRCQSIIIQLNPDEDDIDGGGALGIGQPIDFNELDLIIQATIEHVDNHEFAAKPPSENEIKIVNQGSAEPLQGIHVALLPIARGDTRLGRLIAIRSQNDEEFGTVEIELMRSILMVLSLHLMNQRQFQEMQSMLKGTVHSLASALDAKDAYTHGHSSRVAELSVQLALRLGLDSRSADSLQLAGILHDIGKIGIDDSVLKKEGSSDQRGIRSNQNAPPCWVTRSSRTSVRSDIFFRRFGIITNPGTAAVIPTASPGKIFPATLKFSLSPMPSTRWSAIVRIAVACRWRR